jgi:hypothetical protein
VLLNLEQGSIIFIELLTAKCFEFDDFHFFFFDILNELAISFLHHKIKESSACFFPELSGTHCSGLGR